MSRTAWEKVKALTERLEKGVASVLSSETWAEVLRVQARFHKYSWNNILLIYLQRPDATKVAGYQTWKSLGRQVRKGEKGIKILAPITRKEVVNQETGEERQVLVGFKTVTVFDVAQTEGPELPTAGRLVQDLYGNSDVAQRLYDALTEVITIPVTEDYDGSGYGCYHTVENRIRLAPGQSLDSKVATLVHEYVHSLAHHAGAKRVPPDHREAVAEGASYVICSYMGLDTGSFSFGYVAAWAKDLDVVRAVGEEIQRIAAEVIDKVTAAMAPDAHQAA